MARAVWLAMTFVCALGAGPAPAHADERVDAIVRALRADPVYVSSSLARAVPPAQVAALRRAVAGSPAPAFVVVAPSFGDEPGLGTLRALPDLLHDRLDRDGLYLAVDASSTPYAQAFGVRPATDIDRLFVNVSDDRPDATPGVAARYALALLTTGKRAPVPGRPRHDDDAVNALPVVAAGIGAGALGFGMIGWPWLAGLRRRRAQRRAKPPEDGPALTPVSPPLDADALRRDAHRELAELSAALAAATQPPDAAFDAYGAASKLLDEAAPRAIELLAALELARAGRAALRGNVRRPCFFDPRHGAGTNATRWRLGTEETDIPACRACAQAIEQDRAPLALQDDGRPYFGRDTLWARTGFGAIADDLPQRVLAGEARR
jgi:hypothetical protein